MRELKITFLCLINGGTGNLITLVLWVFVLWIKVNILLDLLCKTDLQHKEICASDWLKPPILTSFRFFMIYIPDLALRNKKPINS